MRYEPLLVASAIAFQVAACDAPVAPLSEDAAAIARFASHATWGGALSVDPGGANLVNTAMLEGCPNESPDGRSLFFASNRSGNLDIWVSRRNGNGDWGEPEQLPAPVNSAADDFCPTALPGGALMFVSTRDDGLNCGVNTPDIYAAREHPVRGWIELEHLDCQINSPVAEFSPSYVPAGGGMLFFSSNRSGKHAIYVSLRGPGGAWQPPETVDELNLAGTNNARPNVSQDGREIVFDSDRDDLVTTDIWYSTRPTPWAEWSPPVNAGPAVNSPMNETRASLSRDGKRLYFGSNRSNNFDIYVSHRN